MKRADKRTARDIAIQRLTNLMDLPDRDLCQADHKTSAAPKPHRQCGHNEITETGVRVSPTPANGSPTSKATVRSGRAPHVRRGRSGRGCGCNAVTCNST